MLVKIFLCYADQDKNMVSRLRNHFTPLEQAGYVDVWHPCAILAGTERSIEVEQQLSESQFVLFLISPEFLASQYLYQTEVKQALAKHERREIHIVPILLQPVYWKLTPIGKLQALPKDEKPIALWKPQNEGFYHVASGLHEVIQHWYAHHLSHPTEERKQFLVALSRFVEAVKVQLQPPPRATHTAATLQQLSLLIPHGVTLADLSVGWLALSRSRESDEAPIAQRRKTCEELAAIASQFTNNQGNLANAVKTWKAWLTTFKDSADPRQSAMANTFAREIAELQTATL